MIWAATNIINKMEITINSPSPSDSTPRIDIGVCFG
jgi:hypothetical protein